MAVVTVDTGWPRANVIGHMRQWLYRVDIAADADYLDVPLKLVKSVHLTDTVMTAVGVASIALNANGLTSRVTFNSGGAITNCYVTLEGW